MPYYKAKELTGKKSSGWGDIDILAIHPDGRKYLIEVKGWHMESFSASYFDQQHQDRWIEDLAKKEATKICGSSDFKLVLVVPSIGPRSKEIVKKLADEENMDVWEFEKILKGLIESVKDNKSYDSEVLQMIRLLKMYGFLKNS